VDGIPPEALLERYAPPMRAIAERLRTLVRETLPDAIEAVRPGWGLIGYGVPAGKRTRYVAFVWAEPEHVHLGFEHGVLMDDPDAVLEGAGITKRVRWLTFVPGDPIDQERIQVLIREAVRVALLGRGERLALLDDREARRGA
jgi:hypothetical protein